MKTINKLLNEIKDKGVIFSFGRMNPITKGHIKNIKELIVLGKKYDLKPLLFLSKTQDSKKNPLSYNDKVHFLSLAGFKNIIQKSDSKNAFQILEELSKKYKKVYFVVGNDRIQDFKRLEDYAKEYGITDFKIISSGKRKEGISGTEQRNYAKNDDFENFKKNSPEELSTKEIQSMFNKTKENLK